MPINEAVRRNLSRHAQEYRAAAEPSRIAEREMLEVHAARIVVRKRATELEVMRLELDGMTADEIRQAYSAVSRLIAETPLARMTVIVAGESVDVLVWDE